jgi:hypothetical protein
VSDNQELERVRGFLAGEEDGGDHNPFYGRPRPTELGDEHFAALHRSSGFALDF